MRTMWKIAAVLSVITLVFICVMPHANATTQCIPVEKLVNGELFDHEKSQRYLAEYNAFDDNGFNKSNIQAEQLYVVKDTMVFALLVNDKVACRRFIVIGPLLHKEIMAKIEGLST